MSKTIVFIHGAWVTPLCWDQFIPFFESKGFKCVAPAWPFKDRPIEELRQNPSAGLATLGVGEIVDHYEKAIRKEDNPLLIGHSFGGLFVQMLLDRGLGSAGVAIDPAPPKGVLPFAYPSVLRANLRILATPGGWAKIIPTSFKDFQYAFVNNMPEAAQKAAFDKYVIPETGRVFFQTATALFNDITKVNFNNASRAPLLLIAGLADTICPAAQIRDNYRHYARSTARTDYREFPDRAHWIIAQPGWEEVATSIHDWQAGLPVE